MRAEGRTYHRVMGGIFIALGRLFPAVGRLFPALGSVILAACLHSCVRENVAEDVSGTEGAGERTAICLNSTICQENVTRADQDGFADGDVIATYIVDYENGSPGTLKDNGNRADNLFYTFNEPGYRWVPAYNVYFKDEKTPVDIYGYYPAAYPESVNSYDFEVALDQDSRSSAGMSGYEKSDFLWAKAENKTSADKVIWLNFSHRMAGVKISLVEGSGFDLGEWDAAEKDVLVRNTARNALIDLSDGSVTARGEASYSGIIPQKEDGIYRAVVVPQSIRAGKTLLTVTVGGYAYDLVKESDMIYTGGKMHNFTLTVNKRAAGEYEITLSGESISDWENDKYSHEGTAKEYVIVNVTTPGTIDAVISASGRQVSKVRNLKVTGSINSRDFEVMNTRMVNLSSLNLKDAIIVADARNAADRIPGNAFAQKYSLVSIILPDRLRTIGSRAFASTNITGSLIIPEGVETLEDACFSGCSSLTGQLSLPSTLKHIGTSVEKYEGSGAFYDCAFVCELNLPEGLETIGAGAFSCCRNIYGEIHIPETVRSINFRSFSFMEDVTGSLRIPQNVTMIPEDCFCGSGFNGSLILHDGIVNIDKAAFRATKLKGELHLPKNLEVIRDDAFSNCDFSGTLVLPKTVRYIGSRAFQENKRLIGTVEIPEGVLSIGTRAFYNCRMLEGIVFPESLENILDSEGGAFGNCLNVGRIVCKSRIPPTVSDLCFSGIAKDNFILEVPEGAEQQYRVAAGWSSFKRIAASRQLALSRPALSALNTSVTREFTLYADKDWYVKSCPDWVRLNATSGSGKSDLRLTFCEKDHDGESRSGDVVFTLESGDYEITLNVSQYDCDTPEDGLIRLQEASAGINVVILCDGFNAEEVSQRKSMDIASEAMENLLSIPPFSTFRDRFNVWTAASVSQDSGINSLNTSMDTRFRCIARDGNVGCVDIDIVKDYVRKALSLDDEQFARTLIIMIPNTDDYDGSADLDDSCIGIAFCPMTDYGYPMDFRGMVQYWAGGRTFGKLADESVRYNAFFSNSSEVIDAQSRGWYRNVSLSGKRADTPWKDFARHPDYSSFVDIFEGAMSCSRGIYRSEQNSCMSTRIPYYNTICRYEIMRRIMEYSGDEFSMEFFIENDNY